MVATRALIEIEANWERWSLELADYAAALVRRCFWRRASAGEILAEGKGVEDLVVEAFEKVIQGKHRWDPDKVPDLFRFLKTVVRRLVSNLAKSSDNKVEAIATIGDAQVEVIVTTSDTSKVVEDDLHPDDCRALEEIFDLAEERPDVKAVVDAITNGSCEYPAEVAEVTRLPRPAIYNALRLIRRHVLPPTGRG